MGTYLLISRYRRAPHHRSNKNASPFAGTPPGIIGYRFIHVLSRIGTWVLGIGIVAGFGYIVSHVQSVDFLTRGGVNLAGWPAARCSA